ncbi:hypothetical protein VitviT2T_018933 [Vitis vinifera]|uniref:WIYLD domain-containing protein n=1 Tax=Vitis vinifera TaxID=29760 RepID=A0ABY9CZA2_VITVI|nr:uncharacterized protein LOC100245015 isoform X2 [Vitis vinifera]WKA00593.1 hypothetical protein VitviT2T_018933 [Vitis vinifera]|eukprot:XP_010658294.1 PREDICTED: uncharacterized protein LOC100245015 isoform X2 [Vitis vinifera]
MPPRSRANKVGLKRMDAAVENMRLLGFSDELVRSTIKRLLEVYDGDAGWLFIEEGSYKLLIDTILDEQENGLLKGDSLEGNARDDNDTSSAAMPSTGVEDATSQTNEIGSEDCNPPAAEERTNERDISLDQNPLHTPPHLISSSAPIDSLLMQRRRRFCGWISDNEPNDICTKQLIPATMLQLEKLIRGTDTNSKSRWDEKPE